MRRLKTAGDCRRYLASLINRLEADEIDTTKAGKLAYMVNTLTRIIETSDLETRLRRLEEDHENGEL